MSEDKNKRSPGVTILGCVFIVMGLLNAIFIFQATPVVTTILTQLYGVIGSALFLVVGYGVLCLKRWARVLALVLIGIKTIQVAIGSAIDTKTLYDNSVSSSLIYIGVGYTTLSFIIGCAIASYLVSSGVKQQFRK